MRRGGPQHPKVALLAAALGIPRPFAVGLLECLWHWADDYALRGDLGRYPDGVIADAAGWPGDPTVFVVSLVRCHWLDEDPTCRLTIHDWHQHADRFTKRKLALRGEWFVGQRKDIGKSGARREPRHARTEIRHFVPDGVAEHCVKTSQQEGASALLPPAAEATVSKGEAMQLIDEINRLAGTKFRTVESNLRVARGRLREYAFRELMAMLAWRYRTWGPDERRQWFRPETVLGETKCASYMGQYDMQTPRAPKPPPNPELARIAARDRELRRG